MRVKQGKNKVKTRTLEKHKGAAPGSTCCGMTPSIACGLALRRMNILNWTSSSGKNVRVKKGARKLIAARLDTQNARCKLL